jgi:chromosome partitioning protein
MADFRTRLTLQVIEEVRKFFKEKTFNTIIPRNTRLAEAPSFGKPIHFYDSTCVGSRAYLNLTEEILKTKIELDALVNAANISLPQLPAVKEHKQEVR